MTDPICKVENCNRAKDNAVGYCKKHYMRWKRNGTTETVRKTLPVGRCSYCNTTAKLRDELCQNCFARKQYKGSPEYARAKKGEGHLNSDGYRVVSYKHGRELEHRKVAKARIGQVVHHRDHNKLNNHLDNLELFPSQSEHMKLHQREKRK